MQVVDQKSIQMPDMTVGSAGEGIDVVLGFAETSQLLGLELRDQLGDIELGEVVGHGY
jgi:hypothetical protein